MGQPLYVEEDILNEWTWYENDQFYRDVDFAKCFYRIYKIKK